MSSDHIDSADTKAEALPHVIPLPKIYRPYGGTNLSPSQVERAVDLPRRIFLGSIDEQTFQKSGGDWTVAYFDDGRATRVDLAYDRGANRLSVFQYWRGEFGMGGTANGDKFVNLLQTASEFPINWDKRAKASLEERYNIQYLPTQKETEQFAFFPDGCFKSLACPVPVSKLKKLVACHRVMEADSAIKTPIAGTLELRVGVVNYLEGKNGEFASTPGHLYFHAFDQTGLPPVDNPVWETGADGTRALTVGRLLYVYNVLFPFREIDRVVGHLHDHGIIGVAGAGETSDQAPDAPEFAAVVLQAGLHVQPIHFSYFDRLGRRRTFYEQFSDLDALHALDEDTSDQEILETIESVERRSFRIAAKFEQLFQEANGALVQ